jgi:hypothetical protein
MNNQVKLIDAGKLQVWIDAEFEKRFPNDVYGYADGRQSILDRLEQKVNEGLFDPDTPPVPTIKPGDKVRHKEREMKNGMVILVSQNGEYVDVSWTGISSVTYPITELEVMK